MTERDTVRMEISIAGEPLQLTVPFESQETVRKTERDIDALYNDWRLRFPRKTPKELLAMIAYQYASFYEELRARYDRAADMAASIEDRLDTIASQDA